MAAMKKQPTNPVSTVLVITVGFTIVYLVSGQTWVLYAAILVGLAGALSDSLAKMIDVGWGKLGWLLGLIVPNILMSVVFFCFLTPIAWLSKIGQKKDPLSLKNIQDSMFRDVNKRFEKESFEKPW